MVVFSHISLNSERWWGGLRGAREIKIEEEQKNKLDCDQLWVTHFQPFIKLSKVSFWNWIICQEFLDSFDRFSTRIQAWSPANICWYGLLYEENPSFCVEIFLFSKKKIGLIKGVGCKVVEKFPLSCLKSALDYCNGLAPIQKFFIISKNQLFHTDFVNHMTEFKFSFFSFLFQNWIKIWSCHFKVIRIDFHRNTVITVVDIEQKFTFMSK